MSGDINQTLRELRKYMDAIADYNEGNFPRPDMDAVSTEAVERFAELDAHLSGGGELPADWQPLCRCGEPRVHTIHVTEYITGLSGHRYTPAP